MSCLYTFHQNLYAAWKLSRQTANDDIDALAVTLVDAQVDLNPHQVEAALFACRNPLSHGVILADEVGLGKTIEAGLVLAQRWAERKRRILIIVPANLRKQWHQELSDKFHLKSLILESKSYNERKKQGINNPFHYENGAVICSYPFAKSKAEDLKALSWDVVVIDEAHRLRNVYKSGNVIAKTLKEALAHVSSKILLTATPLQNSLLELYGLTSIIDERVFGDLDSFRYQFGGKNTDADIYRLRERLAPICKRTLRKQVQPYVAYTARHAMVQEFTPSQQEQELSHLVADYLRRPELNALPQQQRHLISLVLWKLLASSSRAIAGALETMAKRLSAMLENAQIVDDTLDLSEDYEALDDTLEEWEEESEVLSPAEYQSIHDELLELRDFIELAKNIQEDAKGKALLKALDRAFNEMRRLSAAEKAIIFTESRKTQDYLYELLSKTAYGGNNGDGIVLFNGTNSNPSAQTIYKNWLKKHQDSDRITGSKTADTRAALVEYFKEQGNIMIATEAAAEGINLQFCSLVINYDLPWNPQRVEQRIGRCHRYGQTYDVVVVNFIDKSNEADQRVYELLAEKFQLFNGVFGTSDEVLGAISSGVDIERRIAAIYRDCREPDAIKKAFAQLQNELAQEINTAINNTRQQILENFGESVQEKLRLNKENSDRTRSQYEQMLMQLTQSLLKDHADFDETGFTLNRLPENIHGNILLGRYELPRRSGNSHLYRIQHPLAQQLIAQAKNSECPEGTLTFDYRAYGNTISTLEPYIGKSGQLTAVLLTVTALNQTEEHLIVSAMTDDDEILLEDDPEKLLRLPAQFQEKNISNQFDERLKNDITQRKNNSLKQIEERNIGYFEQETQKLDEWADDLKLGLESAIKETDRQIKEVRRSATTATTLEEKLNYQKQQRELEGKRNKLRRELYDKQDAIDAKRNELIEQLEAQLEQKVDEVELFRVNWEIV
ncbi:DEAD/DEAH box helicase [Pasteurellaceae bacterium TAE3-ERU1]|nr:DEAD/DEAH box helicase [Pasteurellaceae bacterium TAE3-ERU1]